jgi:archaellum biogenesis ATPase FlaH
MPHDYSDEIFEKVWKEYEEKEKGNGKKEISEVEEALIDEGIKEKIRKYGFGLNEIEAVEREPRWLLYPWLMEGELCGIWGEEGIGKSRMALGLSFDLIEKGKRVVYITCEEKTPDELMQHHFRFMEIPSIPKEQFLILALPPQEVNPQLIRYLLRDEDYDVVILDAWTDYEIGYLLQRQLAKDLPSDVKGNILLYETHLLSELKEILRENPSKGIMLIHHPNKKKEEEISGTKAFIRLCDVVWHIELSKTEGLTLEITMEKGRGRDDLPLDDIAFTMQSKDGLWVKGKALIEVKTEGVYYAILGILGKEGRLYQSQLFEKLNEVGEIAHDKELYYKALHRLMEEGKVKEEKGERKRKYYSLANEEVEEEEEIDEEEGNDALF